MWQRSRDRNLFGEWSPTPQPTQPQNPELIEQHSVLDNTGWTSAAWKLSGADPEPLPAYDRAWQALCGLSFSFYSPPNYTENYAYPLIVSLHDQTQSEQALWDWFPQISDQNFLGLGVRAPFPSLTGQLGKFCWKLKRPDASVSAIQETIDAACLSWNVHPDRIYLLGDGAGAIVALQYLLLQDLIACPQIRIRGVICSQLPKNWPEWIPHVHDDLQGRLMLLNTARNADEYAAIDALSEAGLEVTMTAPESPQKLPGMINQWVMAGLKTAVF